MTADRPLTNASDQNLAAAVEGNLIALFKAMASSLGGEVREDSGLGLHHSFPTNPMFKGAWHTRLKPDEADQAIRETIEWFKSRQAPYFFWWTASGTAPADLGERLARHGLIDMAEQQKQLAAGIRQTEAGAPCMTADLARMDEGTLDRVPKGFRIERVQTASDLQSFKQVFVETYTIPDWAGQAWVDATTRTGIDKSPWRMYLGLLDGKPVATNMLFNGAGVASVYAVATLPEAQNQGIGSAITLKPLLESRDEGYHHAVLFSTEMGVGPYKRIGFRETGSRINRYLWRAG